jgi:hypothetical protein
LWWWWWWCVVVDDAKPVRREARICVGVNFLACATNGGNLASGDDNNNIKLETNTGIYRATRELTRHTSSRLVSSTSPSTRAPTPAVVVTVPPPCIVIVGCKRTPTHVRAMSPPVKTFPAKDLPSAAQVGVNGKVRRTEDGRPIDLARDCELRGLVQYECLVMQPEVAHSPIQCWPVQRLFRK